MSGTRIGFESTFTSGTAQQQYRYTIVADANDIISVRDIRSPYGLIIDSMTRVPQSVIDDINSSILQMEDILGMTTTINGTLTFTAETEKSVSFTTALSNTNYRVYLSPSDFVSARITNKLTTGFTVQLDCTFTGTVGYDLFV